MSATVVSFLLAVGAGTWLYFKFQKYSGNNTQQSLIASCVAGAAVFLVAYFILKSIL